MEPKNEVQDEEIDGLPVLENPCEKCDGRGHSLRGEWDRCVPCGGTGYIATPAGMKILHLIAHNIRTMT